MTTRPLVFSDAVSRYAAIGAKGITVWRSAIEGLGPTAAGRLARDQGLAIVSLCRGGFFVSGSEEGRRKAIDDNRRCIEEAATLGAPLVVLVCGADPGVSLPEARAQIEESISALVPDAAASGVRLAIEPLHPMYAGDRSAVNTLAQARAICSRVDSPWVGIAVDVYHTWWDERLEGELAACGAEGRLFSFHISDWLTPTRDLLEDRGIMGEGCIPIREIRGWAERAGFTGFIEVEIFSRRLWEMDQDTYLERIAAAFLSHA
jgi:sugar phosphate isomerase/epimerase